MAEGSEVHAGEKRPAGKLIGKVQLACSWGWPLCPVGWLVHSTSKCVRNTCEFCRREEEEEVFLKPLMEISQTSIMYYYGFW